MLDTAFFFSTPINMFVCPLYLHIIYYNLFQLNTEKNLYIHTTHAHILVLVFDRGMNNMDLKIRCVPALCLICPCYSKLCSVHIQDNMKSLLSYIVSYYLKHFDEVSNDIYPPPSPETHFFLTFV